MEFAVPGELPRWHVISVSIDESLRAMSRYGLGALV
jgi:hypothetical protein